MPTPRDFILHRSFFAMLVLAVPLFPALLSAAENATSTAVPAPAAPVRHAPSIDRNAIQAAVQEFQSSQSPRWTVSWDPVSGLPRMLTGQTTRSYGATSEAAALAFAGEHRMLLGLIDEKHSVRLVGTKLMRTQWRVTLQQQFAGIDVLDGTIQVVVDGKGRVLYVTNSAWPVSAVDFSIDVGESAVRSSIARRFSGEDVTYNDGPRRVIYPSGNGRLAYVAYVLAGPQGPWRVLVDARTGGILEARRLVVEEKQAPSQDAATQQNPSRPADVADVNDPCAREWNEMGGAAVIEVPDPADPYYVDVKVGVPGLGEFQPQGIGTSAAGIKLFPCIYYTIQVDYNVHTWGGWNTPNGFRDVFFVNVNNMNWYWNLGLIPQAQLFCTTAYNDMGLILPGKAWVAGGNRCGDGLLCDLVGSFQFDIIEPNNTKELYLSVGMQRVSVSCPSWGTIRVKIIAKSRVFDPNPVTTLNQPFTDQDDANEAVPCDAYIGVDLPNLTPPPPGQPWTLTGDYCEIVDITAPAKTYTSARDPNFPYLRRCDMFEAVNAYYHITTNQLYIQSLGFTGLSGINNRAHRVDPHGMDHVDNSQYVGNPPGLGYIEFGEAFVDDAEDADVILHEYGHSIQDNQTFGYYLGTGAGNGFGNETWAMGEGFADYWACSNFADESTASGFDPAAYGEWNKQNMTGTRRVDKNKIYPTNMESEEHADGEIWSRTLWDLFQAVGKTTSDVLILESHYLVPSRPLFSDGAKALIAADAVANAGANKNTIVAIYVDRGIFRSLAVASSPINGVPITVSRQDVRGDQSDATDFNRTYAWGDSVSLDAPPSFGDRTFTRWDVDGVAGANGDLTAVVRMDESPPFHSAIAYYDTLPGDPGTPVRDIPKALALLQNHPNPFNPTTTITFTLPREMEIELSVFDVAGRRVATLRSGRERAGVYAVVWDGRSAAGETVSSGVYIYRLRAGQTVLTRKMTLLK